MQAQDATTVYLLKLWPWVEANKNRLIGGAVIVVVAVFLIWFIAWQREEKETAAGQALTQLAVTPDGQTADDYLKIATEYPDTMAGQRALLQAAAALFVEGKYTDARTQFQKYLDAHPDNEFSGQASLGVAASFDAQGKTGLAADAYQRIVNSASDPAVINAAKFALARIDDAQGHYNEALMYYEDVARSNPNGSLGAEAGLRLMELQSRATPTPQANPPAAAPVAPFKLSQ